MGRNLLPPLCPIFSLAGGQAVAEFVSPFIKSRPQLGHGEKQASALRRCAARFCLAWKTGRRLFHQGRHAIRWRKEERRRFVQRRRRLRFPPAHIEIEGLLSKVPAGGQKN